MVIQGLGFSVFGLYRDNGKEHGNCYKEGGGYIGFRVQRLGVL